MKVKNLKEFSDYIETKIERKLTQNERGQISCGLLVGISNTDSILEIFKIKPGDLELEKKYFNYINTPLEERMKNREDGRDYE